MIEPFDEISTAAERAREHLREDFEQLRAEIEGEVEESPGGSSPAGGGNRNKAWASFAAFALAAAVAAAAANFGLNGGRTSKDGSVSLPPSSSQPEPGAITAAAGSPRVSSPLLAAVAPALQFEVFGSKGALPGAPSPFPSAESVFVVGALTPVGERGVPSENVAGADPVDRPPAAGQAPGSPLAQPDAPQVLAYTPPPPPDGGHGGGEGPGEGPGGGGGEGPGGGRPVAAKARVAAAKNPLMAADQMTAAMAGPMAMASEKAISRAAEKAMTVIAPARATRSTTAAKSRQCPTMPVTPGSRMVATVDPKTPAVAVPRNTGRATKRTRAPPLLPPRRRRLNPLPRPPGPNLAPAENPAAAKTPVAATVRVALPDKPESSSAHSGPAASP